MNGGYMNKAYDINLSTGEVQELSISDEDRALYVGGKGLGVRLLYDQTSPGMDPYDEEMVLIFATGPVTGTGAPQSNRFVVITKSPLTGAVATATCGGNFATKLRKAGADLILVRGRAKEPVTIEVTEAGVEIKDATDLWGKGTEETQALLPKGFGKAVIGPAGENRVRFAGIVSEDRIAARAGVGAVMGSKNLKAVIANGKAEIPLANASGYKKLRKKITKFLMAHPMTGDTLARFGTANIVQPAAGKNILPVNNFKRGTDVRAVKITGERLADEHLKKQVGCTSCPIICGRGIERDGKVTKGPEYETIALAGSNIGAFDLPKIFEWNHLLDDMGLDSISTGNVIGFATELAQDGKLDAELSFDEHDHVAGLIEDIAHRRGLGDDLAEGVKRLSEKYGGEEYAIHVKGLELPGYDPRGCYGQGLEYATTNRGGCHVQGSTMFLEATGPLSVDPLSTEAKPELVILQQNLAAGIASTVFCQFALYGILPSVVFGMNPQSAVYRMVNAALLKSGPILRLVLKLKTPLKIFWFEKFISEATGRRYTMGDFAEMGERVFTMERLYNFREGFTAADDTLPKRLTDEPTFEGLDHGVPLDEMLPHYYKVRGWDEGGAPKESTVERLQIRH